MPKYDVLLDSDAFIGLILKHDAHHQAVELIFEQLKQNQAMLVTTNYVITETASTLSRRFSQDKASQFLTFVDDFWMITITDKIHRQASQLFRQQTKENTSLVDISNVVVMKEFEIAQIFSFDKVYTKEFQLSLVS